MENYMLTLMMHRPLRIPQVIQHMTE